MHKFIISLLLCFTAFGAVNNADLTGTTGNVQTNIDQRLSLWGGTVAGNLQFSDTASPGLRLKNLTTTQRNSTTPGAGDLIWNTTTTRVNNYTGSAWTDGWVRLGGDTMTGPLGITGGTVTASAPLLDLSQTWNNAAVAFEGAKLNITDTTSSASSVLFRGQIGGSDKFSFSKGGSLTLGGVLSLGGVTSILVGESANTISIRNAANAQTFNTYGTYTDASNYRRLRQTMTTGGAVTIAAEGLGTGVSGNTIDFTVNGSTGLSISSGVSVTSGGAFVAASTSSIGWISQSRMLSPSNGVIGLYNQALSDFTRLQFGGTTASFPSIKRNATALNFRLADDSADAPVTAGNISTSGTITAGGAAFKVLSNTATWDPASMIAAGTTTTTITVTGATVGSPCTAGLTTLTTQGVMITANVSAADTVTVVLFNPTASPVDLSSGTLKANCFLQ